MDGLFRALVWNAIEATLLALAVAAASCVIRPVRQSAPARYALWFLVLLRLLVPPLGVHSYCLSSGCGKLWQCVTSLASTPHSTTPTSTSHWAFVPNAHEEWTFEAEQTAENPPMDSTILQELPQEPVELGIETVPLILEVSDVPTSVALPGKGGTRILHRFTSFCRAVCDWVVGSRCQRSFLALWLAGSACLLLLRVRQCLSLQRLVRTAQVPPPKLKNICADVARRMGIDRMPDLRIVSGSISPHVCALGRSTIVLPSTLLDMEAEVAVVRAVLAHELAHWKRRDHWGRWIELLASLPYWWHPAFWWVRRQMRRAADEAADAWAVAVVGGRQCYAESLVETLELLVADRAVAVTWGPALGERDTISRRLTMIMKGPLRSRLSWPASLGIAVVGLLVLPAAPRSLGAQEAKAPVELALGAVAEEEFAAAANLGEVVVVFGGPQERPVPPAPPPPPSSVPPERPQQPYPPRFPGSPEGPQRRDPDRRLNELEEKVDRILQMLEAMQSGRPGLPGAGAMQGFGPGGMGAGMGRGFRFGAPGARPGEAVRPDELGEAPRGSGGGAGRGPERGPDMAPEQRERFEAMHREFQAEMQRIETEQARVMQEFQHRRAELQKKQEEFMREFQREMREFQRERSERAREAESRRRSDDARPRERGERRGPERPREEGDRQPEPESPPK